MHEATDEMRAAWENYDGNEYESLDPANAAGDLTKPKE
jgi:hypothetical protein